MTSPVSERIESDGVGLVAGWGGVVPHVPPAQDFNCVTPMRSCGTPPRWWPAKIQWRPTRAL